MQLEMAEELRSVGHQVDKFSYEDAFPRGRSTLAECLDGSLFARRARAFVRERAAEFDVIDAQHGSLPYQKSGLRFAGFLVARSVGLYAHYTAFAREESVRWPDVTRGSSVGRALRGWRDWRSASAFPRSLRAADLINVCNQDELEHVRDVLGLGAKCVNLPFGMSAERRDSFRKERMPVADRLAMQTVAFIGYWAPRKGSLDFEGIVRRVWAVRPTVRFLFLGTGRLSDTVRDDLGVGPSDDRIAVVPAYNTEDLPALLRRATVGAFPSYIEGFPFGVLELLAAGLPTIAYDVPGSRELPRKTHPGWLVAAGDRSAFARRLLDLLEAAPHKYAQLSNACAVTADELTWPQIVRDTLKVYADRMQSGGR